MLPDLDVPFHRTKSRHAHVSCLELVPFFRLAYRETRGNCPHVDACPCVEGMHTSPSGANKKTSLQPSPCPKGLPDLRSDPKSKATRLFSFQQASSEGSPCVPASHPAPRLSRTKNSNGQPLPLLTGRTSSWTPDSFSRRTLRQIRCLPRSCT